MAEFVILCIGLILVVVPVVLGIVFIRKMKNFSKMNKSLNEGKSEYAGVNLNSKLIGVVVFGMLFIMTLAFSATLICLYITYSA